MARALSGFSLSGLSAPDAYLNISAIQMSFSNREASVFVNIYASKASRDAGVVPILGLRYDFTDEMFTEAFGSETALDQDGRVSGSANNAVRATAYQALLSTHPESVLLLRDSTPA